ncbi:MAG TPA: FAD-dependent thymidylate synthase [candidate division Zixibacteria bacterium]|nr:FAD-dependent thymidylate synthase [candidate division Zixibacteria bacterium]
MANDRIKKADALIDKQFNVLDHGFVRLIDYMGSDAAIVQAARVSYGAGTKKVSQDRGLIRYLMRNRHTSPFEMVEFKFHVKLPIFVARQWIRHRTANVNELSGRYSVMKEEFYIPNEAHIGSQAKDNKQGRTFDEVPAGLKARFVDWLNQTQGSNYARYHELVEDGLARELARINLPLSLYTEWYWKIDLHNLFHFLRLRLDKHAQLEIRLYAEVMTKMVKAVCPLAYEAFEDYILNAASFSAQELTVLKPALAAVETTEEALVEQGLSKREAAELIDKLERIKKL